MILIAKCRLGEPCRYHGRVVISPALIKQLCNTPHYKTICPECEAGLAVPRPPIRIYAQRYFLGAKDITNLLHDYCAQKCLALQGQDITRFIGVKGSPCCDPQNGIFSIALIKIGIIPCLSL